MKELPADLAEPLHLLNPYPLRMALAALVTALLLLALWFLWRRLRRRPVPAEPPAAIPAPPDAVDGFRKVIARIRDRHLRSRQYRRGCHELSAVLRAYFERAKGHRLSTLTAREIAAAIADTSLASLFQLLAELQFSRRDPTRNDFRGICDMAAEQVSSTEGA